MIIVVMLSSRISPLISDVDSCFCLHSCSLLARSISLECNISDECFFVACCLFRHQPEHVRKYVREDCEDHDNKDQHCNQTRKHASDVLNTASDDLVLTSALTMDLDDPDEPAGAPVGGVLLDLGDDDLHVLVLLHHPPVSFRVGVQRLPHPRAGHGGLHTPGNLRPREDIYSV